MNHPTRYFRSYTLLLCALSIVLAWSASADWLDDRTAGGTSSADELQEIPEDAIIKDYISANVSAPPEELGLDPFYQKYADALGIPVTGSSDVPDHAILVARDVVIHMLAGRADLRSHMAENGFRLAVMAVTDSTTDLPEQRDWKKPSLDDPRLTDGERRNYERIAAMTDQEYWNTRARGMGGRLASCAEENILGYPGTRYYGENILVHEFSHSIHSAIREVDPDLNRRIREAYEDAREKGLWQGHYGGNTLAEYWAEGTQYWFNSNYDHYFGETHVATSDDLKEYDPVLFDLLAEVYPNHHIPMDVYHMHEDRLRAMRARNRE